MDSLLFLLGEEDDCQPDICYTAVEAGPRLEMDPPRGLRSGWVMQDRNDEVHGENARDVYTATTFDASGEPRMRTFLGSPSDPTAKELPHPTTRELLLRLARNQTSVCLRKRVAVPLPAFFTAGPVACMSVPVIQVEPAVTKLADLADVQAALRRFAWSVDLTRRRMSEVIETPPPAEPPPFLLKYQQVANDMPLLPPLFLPVHAETGTATVSGVWQFKEVTASGLWAGPLFMPDEGVQLARGTSIARTVQWREGQEARALTRVIGRIA